MKQKKVGVVVKGCDSRTIVQYMQEALIDRERVVVIGVPCKGVVSVKKVLNKVSHQPIVDVKFNEGDTITVKTPAVRRRCPSLNVAPGKCGTCHYPTPVIHDRLVGEVSGLIMRRKTCTKMWKNSRQNLRGAQGILGTGI